GRRRGARSHRGRRRGRGTRRRRQRDPPGVGAGRTAAHGGSELRPRRAPASPAGRRGPTGARRTASAGWGALSAPFVAVVIGASGGAGATTLALGVALHLAMTSRHPTLLELDLVKGGLAAGLGIDADRGLHDLRPVADELKPEHLARVAYPHR